MKKFLLLIAMLMPLTLNAQQVLSRTGFPVAKAQFVGYTMLTSDLAFLQGRGQLNAELVLGCQVSNYFYGGFQTGVGLVGMGYCAVPLGVELKGFWPVGAKTSLFAGFDLGTVLIGDLKKPDTVLNVTPKIGIEVGCFVAHIGLKTWTTRDLAVNYLSVGIGFRLGRMVNNLNIFGNGKVKR